MAVLPRCIDILTNLFSEIPEDIYNAEEMRKNIVSSLFSIFNLFSRIASDSEHKSDFIFRSDADVFLNTPKSLKGETVSHMCNSLVNLTEKLSFENDIDNDITKNVCNYLREYINTSALYSANNPRIDPFMQETDELKRRIDCPAIVCYLFCQILFAHSYSKKYGEDLSVKYPDRLLFNKELDKYQISLPYEDQVTCSYFVYRYIYLPDERERQYSETRNKYDCGFRSSKPMKYKFTEVNKISEMSNSDTPGERTTSYSNFINKIVGLNLLKSMKNKSKNYSLLKFYLLVRKIKNRREFARSANDDDKYGFDMIKMLNSSDIENFIFNGLPYENANGYHSTILLSEIKKDIEFKDLIDLTSYYIKSMSYLKETSETFRKSVDEINDSKWEIAIPTFLNLIQYLFNTILPEIKSSLSQTSSSVVLLSFRTKGQDYRPLYVIVNKKIQSVQAFIDS